MAVRPNPTSLLAPYIYYYLLHKFQHFQSSATATTVPGIKKQDIENLIIPVPSVNEQQTIVNYLDNLLEKIEGLSGFQEMTKQETDALLPAVLDKAFKGEL